MVGFIWFLYKYYDRFTIRHIPKFWPLKNFFGELLVKKIQFSSFLEGKGFIFASYLHNRLRNANDFALTDRTPFNWPACSENFYHNFFRSVFAKKSWKFWVFLEQIRQSPLPTAFLHFDAFFPETHVSDPFAYCLAVMTRSYLIGAENLGWRNFFAGEFLAKTYEKPGFFRGQLLFCRTFLAQKPMYGIPMIVRHGERSVNCIQSLVDNFLIFHNNLPETFCWEKWNFKWIFCIIQNVALSASLRVMHITWNHKHVKQYVQQRVLMQIWP